MHPFMVRHQIYEVNRREINRRACDNEPKVTMTEREMFEKSFERPSNFFKLSAKERQRIDKELGILDWMDLSIKAGDDLTTEDLDRFNKHYDS